VGQAGVTAILDNTDGTQPVTVTLAAFAGDPGMDAVGGVGTTFLEIQLSGVTSNVSMTTYFYYPAGVGATTLQYDDSVNGWTLVQGSGGEAPILDDTSNLDGTTSGGRYTVVFDATSTPSITNLQGTVFALATIAPPVAIETTLSAVTNHSVSQSVGDLLTNVGSLNGGTLSITGITSPSTAGGTVILANGVITYTPPANFIGTDQFTYTFSDGYTNAQGTVLVDVTSGPPPLQSQLSIWLQGNCVGLNFLGTPGASYVIQWAPALSGPWTDFLPALTADTNGVVSYSDCDLATTRYYQVIGPQ
jgi:hypothetical protein